MTRKDRVLVLGMLPMLSFFVARPATAGTSRIYVTNSAGDSVTVVDPGNEQSGADHHGHRGSARR